MLQVKTWSEEASFSLAWHEENGRRTALIKDWKDMTTSVSDMQSLLGSLKDSPFFGAFADTVSQYETKLALLDHAARLLFPIFFGAYIVSAVAEADFFVKQYELLQTSQCYSAR